MADESENLNAHCMDLLAVAYRTRPRSIEDLAAVVASPDPAQFARSVATLERLGFLRRNGDELIFDSPYATFIEHSNQRMQQMQADTEATVTVMASLPTLIRNWDLGEVEPDEGHPLAASVIHGRVARSRFWRERLTSSETVRPGWILPDLDVLEEVLDAHPASEVVGSSDVLASARLLVKPETRADAAHDEMLDAAVARGVHVRMLADLPSWTYIDDTVVGIPIDWGETAPPSVLFIRTPPVVAAMRNLFEQLWTRAEPRVLHAAGWEPILNLLGQGLTDGAIARSLGQDARTVRRRVAEAMTEFGVTSRFALGVAWATRFDAARREQIAI